MTRSYPEARRYSTADDMMRDKHGLPPRPVPQQWGWLKVQALIVAIEAVCFLALLWGQGWRP